jgi:lysyl-tRNA synthetase class 2
MSTADQIKKLRLKKIAELTKNGELIYPSQSRKNSSIGEVLLHFEKWSKKRKKVCLAGRIMSLRFHGGIIFIDLRDGSGNIQLVFKKGETKNFENVENYFDVSDFIEVDGYPFQTQRGEKSLMVLGWGLLAKSLKPLPSEWYGLKDVEERFRKRYLDIALNKEVKNRFNLRAKIIQALREFLEKNEFIEVETPILQTLHGGALARPFKTKLNALNIPLYLRIAPELYLKRLIVGGFEKIYEIGKCFRNEGIDKTHNPEFTMMELYWAYQNYEGLMNFIEELIMFILKKTFSDSSNPLLLVYDNKTINFEPPWPRVNFLDLIKKKTNLDPNVHNEKEILAFLQSRGVEIKEEMKNQNKWELLDEVYKKICMEEIIQPTFIIHHPVALSPLAKIRQENKEETERFQLVVAGVEFVNGYSELNDPVDQAKRFKNQEQRRRAGNEEASPFDKDFIEALEYGMPPTAGVGIGIDRLVMLLTNAPSIKEVIFFPFMKNK